LLDCVFVEVKRGGRNSRCVIHGSDTDPKNVWRDLFDIPATLT
jgi:hypothetical protein